MGILEFLFGAASDKQPEALSSNPPPGQLIVPSQMPQGIGTEEAAKSGEDIEKAQRMSELMRRLSSPQEPLTKENLKQHGPADTSNGPASPQQQH